MKAVLLLVYRYFISSRFSTVCTLLGLALYLLGAYMALNTFRNLDVMAYAAAGQVALFAGTLNMPLMFGRLAQGHGSHLLPAARWKLLISAMIMIALVSLPAGLISPLVAVVGASASFSEVLKHPEWVEYIVQMSLFVYTSMCIFAAWLYVAAWFIGNERNLAGLAKGLLLIALLLYFPTRIDAEVDVLQYWNLKQLAVICLVFGIGFLNWPRIRRQWPGARARAFGDPRGGRTRGRELDLMLGTARPGMLIASQLIPLLIMTKFTEAIPDVWLFFLTVLSVVTGALSSQAAARSRALWLRGGWSRAELFGAVERSFWKHNAVVLAAQIAFLLVVGLYSEFPAVILVAGLPLLVLGTALSTYLGLMTTRGVRWGEAVLGAGIMLTLMVVTLTFEGDRTSALLIGMFELALAVLVVILRATASQRWSRIDWTLTRGERIADA